MDIDEQLHEPLLNDMKNFKLVSRNKNDIIYHGSREFSPHTDYDNKVLLGDRKWFSDDKVYAVSYAFTDMHIELGRPLLWKCRFKVDIQCLTGSQSGLIESSLWNGDFPSQFPNNFYKYARKIQGEQPSYVLLNHLKNNNYDEILVALHYNLVEVLEVFVLPDDKEEAVKFVIEGCLDS